MRKLELENIPIEQLMTTYLEKIDKAHEFDRIMNSMWTKIQSENVISLDLSRLGIDQVDPSIFAHPAFSNLEYLYLQGNNITDLHHSLFELLPSLNGLNLPNNQIKHLKKQNFRSLVNLEWLNLSFNHLTLVENFAFDGLTNLSSLNLSHNRIERISELNFSGLRKLQKLNLCNNRLVSIEGQAMKGLDNLSVLNLQSNRIVDIEEDITSFLPSLEKLYLKHNPAFSVHNTFETRFEIIEVLRSQSQPNAADAAMTELLQFEDDEIISAFNQLIEDPRWDGGIGRVSNYKLSQVTGISIDTIARKIEALITRKKLNNIVHFDNNDPMAFEKHYWIRPTQTKESINTGINEPKCLWCNEELADPFEPCHNCGLECAICKFSIKQSQEFDVCTSESEAACRDIFHRSEYLEWVRIYGSCPKCSQEINLNLYQISQDYSKKVGSLVEQDMELIPDNQSHSNDFLVPMSLSILINLKKIRNEVQSSEELIKSIGKETRDQHQEILKELQPLATEIVLITAFLDRLEANSLTEKSFKASIDRIADRFDIFEDNIDIIYESHKKDNGKIDKIKKVAVKGSVKGGGVGVKALAERSGLIGKIKNYVSLPTKEGLKSIFSRIGQGIRDKTGDPTSWIKLGALFLI